MVHHLGANATPIHGHAHADSNMRHPTHPSPPHENAPGLAALFRTTLGVAGTASIVDPLPQDPLLQQAAPLPPPPLSIYHSLYTAFTFVVLYGIIIMGRAVTTPQCLSVFTSVDFYVWFCLLVFADLFLRMFYPKLVDQLAQAALFNIATLLMSPLKLGMM